MLKSNRRDGRRPSLAYYFTVDAARFAIAWGCLSFSTRMLLILRWLAVRLHRSRTRATSALTKYWYRNVTRFLDEGDLMFLNYGYASLDDAEPNVALLDDDEPNRMPIQLYHHVVGPMTLADLDVLEVSCGHGGGASYVMRYLKPRSLVAVDLNANAIDWCQRTIRVEGLSFSQGDAQSLPFEPCTFDVVVNVEASHAYPDMQRFLSEVARVLRPGGYLLFADVRMSTKASDVLDRELADSGLELTSKEDITANVVKALEMDSDRRLEMVQRLVPRFLQGYFKEWAAVEGSSVYESFRTGEAVYLSSALRKPSS
jgi:ubiquinone/menaquinone biosynthesis C-methylase UbiE